MSLISVDWWHGWRQHTRLRGLEHRLDPVLRRAYPYKGFTFGGWFFGVDALYTPGSGAIDLYTDYANPSDPLAYVITNTNNQIMSATAFVFEGAAFSGYSGVTFQL